GPGLSVRTLGDVGGATTVTLDPANLPAHSHEVRVAGTGGTGSPAGAIFGSAQARAHSAGYSAVAPSVPMSAAAVTSVGEGQSHDNMAPHIPLTFCIALEGAEPL